VLWGTAHRQFDILQNDSALRFIWIARDIAAPPNTLQAEIGRSSPECSWRHIYH
jgi:hypothetical protein